MKVVKKAYKYKLKTNKSQEQILSSWIHTCRAVYNLALETKIYAYKANKTSLGKYDLIKQLPELKKDFDWIKDVPSQTMQAVIERMDTAYKTFFKGGGFPKYASRDRYNSILFKQSIKIDSKAVSLPKIGRIKYFCSRLIPQDAIIKQATITKEIDGFYISISVQETISIAKLIFRDKASVGIDMGVAKFLSTSQGIQIDNPQILKTYKNELRFCQRSLARKKKFSNNWYKQKDKLAKIHLKIRRVRLDFLHKQSAAIVKQYDVIAIENLKLKNMTKSSKGSSEEPGKMVKQKSGLNRVLLDVSIGEFFRQLEYKASWSEKKLVRVNPKNTSRECSHCGHISKENRKTQSSFECVICEHKENADINAAKNILARAIANVPKRKAVA